MLAQFTKLRQFVDEKFNQLPTMVCSAYVPPVADLAPNVVSASGSSSTWASVADALRDSSVADAFQLVVNKKKRSKWENTNPQPSKIRVSNKVFTGAKSSDDNKVVAVPRPLVAFVGRLQSDTTEGDLTD